MTEATETSTETKKGRPKNSATKSRQVVTALITVDACPKCGGIKPPVNKRFLRGGEATATVKGVVCGSYKHYSADCADCGSAFLYREYRAAE